MTLETLKCGVFVTAILFPVGILALDDTADPRGCSLPEQGGDGKSGTLLEGPDVLIADGIVTANGQTWMFSTERQLPMQVAER